MKEQLIIFDTAKLAKEKGFEWAYPTMFDEGMDKYMDYPTQSLLLKWLRENYDIHIHIISCEPYDWEAKEFSKGHCWTYTIEKPILTEHGCSDKSSKKTYEEALEIALQEALKLLK